MEALRIITKPVNGQLVIDLPPSLTSDRQYEAIVLPVMSEDAVATPRRRQPSQKLAGTVRLLDDPIAPATPDSDWEFS
ncbi:hypothetical protein [Phormidium sp. CCY1219]|uniref:hypothetical protein n=1 Tax=Phormidium sp. CCY1219 TaxID=2886104 RepID=UPI002D1EE24D|nr:hypothetical protein [Phormidium sp. CCY1219]MEB3826374.1 hypothetical protein [Phormidium sp. CCY1219]